MKKILLMLVLFSLTRCGEVHCPGFPKDLLKYLPYTENDVVKYSNGVDTIAFEVVTKFVDGSYSFKKNCDCLCRVIAGIETNFNELINFKIDYSISVGEQDTIFRLSFGNNNFSNKLWFTKKEEIYKDNVSSITYTNVIFMQSNEETSEINNAVIAENFGLIRFEQSEQQWYLIENE